MVYSALGTAATAGDVSTLSKIKIPNTKFTWPAEGNYMSGDKKLVASKIQFAGIPKSGATTTNSASIISGITSGIASAGFTGTASSLTTTAGLTSATTAFAAPAAATCPATVAAVTGAMSTVMAVGASIAALAMAF